MWHALRAELAYSRPFLLGSLGISLGIVLIASVMFFVAGEDGPSSHEAAAIRGVILIMAPMVAGFVAQAYRSQERRARLLLAGPLTPRQIAGAAVLLPAVLLGVGVLAAGLVVAAGALVTGKLELESLHVAGFVSAQMFTYVQMGLLVQEAVAAHDQRRLGTAAVGWAAFVVAVLFLAALYVVLALGALTWLYVILGHLIVVVAAMVATTTLYAGRTDFTR